MSIPDRPDDDEIITEAWGQWVHDLVAPADSAFTSWSPNAKQNGVAITDSLSGRYVRLGRIVIATVDGMCGPGGAAGAVTVSLPIAGLGVLIGTTIGSGRWYDSTAGRSYGLSAVMSASGSDATLYDLDTGEYFGDAGAIASLTQVNVLLIYEAIASA